MNSYTAFCRKSNKCLFSNLENGVIGMYFCDGLMISVTCLGNIGLNDDENTNKSLILLIGNNMDCINWISDQIMSNSISIKSFDLDLVFVVENPHGHY